MYPPKREHGEDADAEMRGAERGYQGVVGEALRRCGRRGGGR